MGDAFWTVAFEFSANSMYAISSILAQTADACDLMLL